MIGANKAISGNSFAAQQAQSGARPEVLRELERVESFMAEAEHNRRGVEEQLSCVLRPVAPEPAGSNKLSETPQCEMGARLMALADRLEAHAIALADVQCRACV